MSEKRTTYINAPMPDWTYVLRFWLVEEDDPQGMQANVVIVRSDHPLTAKELHQSLENLVSHPTRYELVGMPRNCTASLDTWERAIEFTVPIETKIEEIPVAKEWWRDDKT